MLVLSLWRAVVHLLLLWRRRTAVLGLAAIAAGWGPVALLGVLRTLVVVVALRRHCAVFCDSVFEASEVCLDGFPDNAIGIPELHSAQIADVDDGMGVCGSLRRPSFCAQKLA